MLFIFVFFFLLDDGDLVRPSLDVIEFNRLRRSRLDMSVSKDLSLEFIGGLVLPMPLGLVLEVSVFLEFVLRIDLV